MASKKRIYGIYDHWEKKKKLFFLYTTQIVSHPTALISLT